MIAHRPDISPFHASHGIKLPQLDGICVLNKPAGPSSAQCVAKIKRLGQKKIGHAGTLDPMAEGVLLILLGQATKISSYLMAGGKKIYHGLARLGVETDTWDAEGNVVAEKDWRGIDPEFARREIESWTELREQAVPPYSAAKHQGRPLYKLAREGADVPQKIKPVKIFQADMLSLDMPWARFRVICGSGVYIRSLAHSLGKRLGCGAALFGLTREYSHPFSLEQAIALDDALANPAMLRDNVRPLREALPGWPQIGLSGKDAAKIRNGAPLATQEPLADGTAAILCEGETPLALANLRHTDKGRFWTVARGLWN